MEGSEVVFVGVDAGDDGGGGVDVFFHVHRFFFFETAAAKFSDFANR